MEEQEKWISDATRRGIAARAKYVAAEALYNARIDALVVQMDGRHHSEFSDTEVEQINSDLDNAGKDLEAARKEYYRAI